MNIMIIATGTMGLGIVQVLAQNNNKILLNGRSAEKLELSIKKIKNTLDKQIDKGKITEKEKESIIKNITTTIHIEDGTDCDSVVEAIAEDIEIKKNIFRRLDKVCTEKTILATNTSSLSKRQ